MTEIILNSEKSITGDKRKRAAYYGILKVGRISIPKIIR